MPWKVSTSMSERRAFCVAVLEGQGSMASLCRQYGISRKTGYKWLQRFAADGEAGLGERSRRPHAHPQQTGNAIEEAVVAVRQAHPTWGGRKIAKVLQRQGVEAVPAPSTITHILHRYALIAPEASAQHRPCQRFAMGAPNELWQMDYKGHFVLGNGTVCHPLSVLDDHARFLVGLDACADESRQTVQAALTARFRTYGLPERILTDNGPPWGYGPGLQSDPDRSQYTRLTVWLLRLGVAVSHGRIRHPQTQGKDERLHRTLGEDLLQRTPLADLASCQSAFDAFRWEYNHLRPHEALNLDVPALHYQPSLRPFPETLAALLYDEGACLRHVDKEGRLGFRNRSWRLGKAFAGEWVAVNATATDGCYAVCYGTFPVLTLDLRSQGATP